MKQFIYGFFIIFISLFLISNNHIHAAQLDKSYDIEQLDMFLRIKSNGDIEVQELFKYQFKGEFDTITRTIGDDNHGGIKDFRAFEIPMERYNGESPDAPFQELSSNKKDETFNISRSAKDETVIFYYEYMIENGVSKFNDISEFYWRFLDSKNESDIHNITIQIKLDEGAEKTEDFTFGTVHDWSLGTSKTKNNNFSYSNEFLPAGELLEVRLLFPSAFTSDMGYTAKEDKLDEFLAEEKKFENKEAFKEKTLPLVNVIDAGFVYIAIILIIAGVLIRLFYIGRKVKPASIYDLTKENSFTLTIIQKNKKVDPRFLYAALFSLYQKGVCSLHLNNKEVNKEEANFTFELNEINIELKENEQYLIDWLFKENNDEKRRFSLKDIPKKEREGTKEEKKKAAFMAKDFAIKYKEWTKLVKSDYKTSAYFTNFKLYKWMMYIILPVLIVWGAGQMYFLSYKFGAVGSIMAMMSLFIIYALILMLQYYSSYLTLCLGVIVYFSLETIATTPFYQVFSMMKDFIDQMIHSPNITIAAILMLIATLVIPKSLTNKQGEALKKGIKKWRKQLRNETFSLPENESEIETLYQHTLVLEKKEVNIEKLTKSLSERETIYLSDFLTDPYVTFKTISTGIYLSSVGINHYASSSDNGASGGSSGGGGGAGAH